MNNDRILENLEKMRKSAQYDPIAIEEVIVFLVKHPDTDDWSLKNICLYLGAGIEAGGISRKEAEAATDIFQIASRRLREVN